MNRDDDGDDRLRNYKISFRVIQFPVQKSPACNKRHVLQSF